MPTLGELREHGAAAYTRQAVLTYGFYSHAEQALLQDFTNQSLAYKFPAGWDILSDDGCYSVVMTSPNFPDKVLKVSIRNDSAYAHYMEDIVLKQQGNPHVPKVYGYAKFSNGSFIVLMERLEELSPTAPNKQQVAHTKLVQKLTDGALKPGTYGCYIKLTRQEVLSHRPCLPEQLFELTLQLWENPQHWEYDLKLGNFMLRGDTLVITDPYSIE